MDGEAAVVVVLGGVLGVAVVLAEGVEVLVVAGAAQAGDKTDAVEQDKRVRGRGVGGVEAAGAEGKTDGVGLDRRFPRHVRLNRCKRRAMLAASRHLLRLQYQRRLPASVASRPRRRARVRTFSCERCRGREGAALKIGMERNPHRVQGVPSRDSLHVCLLAK